MDTAGRVRATMILVMVGIFFSYASYGTEKLGLGTLYPFFHWRLYSAPVASEGAITYRIYTPDSSGGGWVRHPASGSYAYPQYDHQRLLGGLARQADAGTADDSTVAIKLTLLVNEVVPGADTFRVVAESYLPLQLLKDPSRYDTATVVTVKKPGPRARPAQ